MCGDTTRTANGGTIAVVFPLDQLCSSNSSVASLSSSPDSVTSTASMSPYSLFFRDPESNSRKTKATFHIDDADTYNALRGHRQLDMRIEKYGDLSTNTATSPPPLHKFRLDFARGQSTAGPAPRTVEFELPERLDLGASEKGVVGRQVTMEAGGSILGVGIVGYN
ncbi:hypothetical protein N7468_002064 [Penicillium chermesinum]|uniref:Uncharacterized protein n=1 Tax=Penicillium chermesinum TaxID=63820 RepID=A0A9W9PHR8_9EURO|nr:uncharacterized protein N7468_002064 [Penicillium chermesinum]KAJ5247081.1 hypothetical protein N7468_002064 [Penicillium chermesinum]